MKRLIPIAVFSVLALFLFEKSTGRNLGVASTLGAAAGVVDGLAGTNLAGVFAGGYGMTTDVGASMGQGIGGVANNMGSMLGN